MTEYITKEQAIEIVEKHQWDWSRAVRELESLPDAIGRCGSCRWWCVSENICMNTATWSVVDDFCSEWESMADCAETLKEKTADYIRAIKEKAREIRDNKIDAMEDDR